jgi:hypothetical protein
VDTFFFFESFVVSSKTHGKMKRDELTYFSLDQKNKNSYPQLSKQPSNPLSLPLLDIRGKKRKGNYIIFLVMSISGTLGDTI